MNNKLKDLLILFTAFFKIGALTFGGGYSMIPMLKREVVEKQNFITEDELLDFYAMGQVTPGAIAVNTAVLVGNKKLGIIGAIFSTLGVVTPSFFIIMLFSNFINTFSDNEIIQSAFNGIKIVVCALVFKSLVDIMKKSIKDKLDILILLLAFLSTFLISPSYIVLLCGVCGFFSQKVLEKGEK